MRMSEHEIDEVYPASLESGYEGEPMESTLKYDGYSSGLSYFGGLYSNKQVS